MYEPPPPFLCKARVGCDSAVVDVNDLSYKTGAVRVLAATAGATQAREWTIHTRLTLKP